MEKRRDRERVREKEVKERGSTYRQKKERGSTYRRREKERGRGGGRVDGKMVVRIASLKH